MRELNLKQQAFVEYYVMCWNASEAARRAGYSIKTATAIGWENLRKPEIKAAIAARAGEIKATTDEVLLRLAAHSRGSIADVLDDEDELSLNAARDAGKLHLVKKVKQTTRTDPEGNRTTTFEVELHDAQAATVQLAKILGQYIERVEVRTWRDRVIDLLKAKKVTPAEVVAEFGPSLAGELFAQAGVVVSDAG